MRAVVVFLLVCLLFLPTSVFASGATSRSQSTGSADRQAQTPTPVGEKMLTMKNVVAADDLYSTGVQPVFNSRCVACHACYNAPCQLDLSSWTGLSRGANQTVIYDFAKLKPREPTRIYQDAHVEADWHKKGFYSVIDAAADNKSILNYMLTELPGIESGKQQAWESEASRSCPKTNSPIPMRALRDENPASRMPFGLPPLSATELASIVEWEKSGELGPSTAELEQKVLAHPQLKPLVQQWEALFNGESTNGEALQAQLSSRYIYEHLFLAHLYFDEQPQIFFRLVRSATREGAIEELATRFPFDKPSEAFYYRLRPLTNTIVHKNHIPFPLNETKMARWKSDFYDATWSQSVAVMPPYGKPGSNPYKTFAAIPVESRYRFFLDESAYHIMTFIKGPVCRGQTALNVINDHFWVMFVDPEKDISVQSPEAYNAIAKNMEMPAALKGNVDPSLQFREDYWKALKAKYRAMQQAETVFDESLLWNGDRTNSNALITVYRHFNSASVLRGLRGEFPKTVWVLDYHVFEAIYYNLTAGYDVFGPILHQLNSRLYMEMSRIASEDLFLTFLPQTEREPVRQRWNEPMERKMGSIKKWLAELVTESVDEKMEYEYAYPGSEITSTIPVTRTGYASRIEVTEAMLNARYAPEQINAAGDIFRPHAGLTAEAYQYGSHQHPLHELAALPPKVIQYLPDTMFLRLTDLDPEQIWTAIHNKAHLNVGMLFFEDLRRNPSADSLDILPLAGGPYINLMLVLSERELHYLVKALSQVDSKAAVNQVLAKYGVTRRDPEFWQHYEWFSSKANIPISNESGWLDLNRYINLDSAME